MECLVPFYALFCVLRKQYSVCCTSTNSKWAFMDSTGNIVTVGQFVNEKGLLFSNSTYKAFPKTTIIPPKSFNWDDYYLGYYGVTCK